MGDERHLLDVFFDIQRGLPRQGPGSDESTLKALALCAGLPQQPAILDIGCGPGMQTVTLAKTTDGHITAVDTSHEYLDQLRTHAKAAGVDDRIEIVVGDMNDLPVMPASFDAIWSEGAAYIMGFESAIPAWKRFLKPSGKIAVTELVWLRPDPPAEAAAFFAEAYPAMTDVQTVLKVFRNSDYEPVAHFTLPDRSWWEHYYSPLELKLPALYEKYRDNDAALAIVRMAEREIEMRRFFPDVYGYEFFIGRAA